MDIGAAAPEHGDIAIVGGGILGLAVARELTARHPARKICLLEREQEIGSHQTGHNSGVIHSGIYYAPGSLKARLCVEGAGEMYEFCAQRDIPALRCGKLILASRPAELARLQELERRARANGVQGVRYVEDREIQAIEPHARGIAGLHSSRTGIVDFRAVARALAEDLRLSGVTVATGCEVHGAEPARRRLRLRHSHGTTDVSAAVFCAGSWADRLAVAAGASSDPRILPFRGAYMSLVPSRRELVRALIYPVPDPALPFLGVHLTRHIDGQVLVGPTALPILLGPGEAFGTLSWPGTWRMLGRHWRTGLHELRLSASRGAVAAAAARYVPELGPADLEPSFAGIRAQALARNGQLLDDFAFSRTERALHVRNAPSPAATAALAIARHIVAELERSPGIDG